MHVFYKTIDVKEFVNQILNQKKTIGFVPTMGALHNGHLSLIKTAIQQTDIVIVSIFVNPTQFNNAEDLKNYPRDINKDIELLKTVGCHAVFSPTVKDIYPEPDTRVFDFNGLDNIMEGKFRPGHFNGVAQVVSKLFDIIPANKAYFGQKDFQQVAIIKILTKKLNLKTEIIACDTIREQDGLAKSSRNSLLSAKHRENANIIYKSIAEINQYKSLSINDIKQKVINKINANNLFEVEYFEIADTETLQPITDKQKGKKAVACIAVWADKVRLIDNIILNF